MSLFKLLVVVSLLASSALLPLATANSAAVGVSEGTSPECVNIPVHHVADRLGFIVSVFGAIGFVVSTPLPGTDIGAIFGVVIVPEKCRVEPTALTPADPSVLRGLVPGGMLGLP